MGFFDEYNAQKQKRGITGKTVNQQNMEKVGGFFDTAGKIGLSVLKGAVYDAPAELGKGLGNAIGEFSGANQQIQDATNKTVQSNNETVNLLRGKLQKEKDETKRKALQTSIDSINKNTSDMLASTSAHFEEAKAATDPGHIANNAAQLALNLTAAGTLGKSIAGARGAGAAVETGMQVQKASKIAQALKAVTAPTTIKEGLVAGAGLGAVQGGLVSADEKGATPESIFTGALTGAGFGAAGGTLAGFLGKRGAQAATKLATNKTNAEISAVDAGAAKIAEQMDLDKVAQTTAKAASEVTDVPVAQVINASDDVIKNVPDIKPFDQPQMTMQQLEQAATAPTPGQVTNIAENAVPTQVSTINPDELSTSATNSFLNLPEDKLAKPNRLQGEGLSYSEAETGLSKTGKDLQGRIVFGKDDQGNVILKDGRHLLEAYREKGIQVPEGKIKLEGDLTMADVSPSYKTMAAEITPGQTNELTANITLTDKQVQDAVATMGDLKPKEKIQALKEIGATDDQMRAAGVSTTKMKPTKVVDQTPSMAEMNAAKKEQVLRTTSDELDFMRPEGMPKQEYDAKVMEFIDEMEPEVRSTFLQKVDEAVASTEGSMEHMTKKLGSFGSNVTKTLLQGNKVAADMKGMVRDKLTAISKLAKDNIGKTQAERQQFGKTLTKSLEARDPSLLATQAEKDIYSNAVEVLDFIKQKRVESGRQVLENYTPHKMLKDFGEDPDYLKNAFQSEKSRVKSVHDLPRKAENLGEMTDTNILDILPNYVNSMIDDLAYSPALKQWDEGIGTVPSAYRRNKTEFNKAVAYAQNLLKGAVNRQPATLRDKGVQKAANTYYTNALYMNPKNAMYSQLQKLQAMAGTTKEGRSIANSLSKDTKELIRKNLWFGDATQSQDVAAGMSEAKSAIGKALKKADINRIGEASAVNQPFQWGFIDALKDSPIYKNAIQTGKNADDAVKLAMKDPDTLKLASDAGNILVDNSMFGANTLARPELLRSNNSVVKALGMFQRFPLAESHFVKTIFKPSDARALDVLQKGNPMAVPIAEWRNAQKVLAQRLQEGRKAVLSASKTGRALDNAPSLQVLDQQIKLVNDSIKASDDALKAYSNITGPKRAAAFASMWAGSAAVATMFNGALNYGKSDYEAKSFGENLMAQDPTIMSKINPLMPYNMWQGGLTSPLVPANKYGLNTTGVLNLIPGGGIINRATGGGLAEGLEETDLVRWLKGKK